MNERTVEGMIREAYRTLASEIASDWLSNLHPTDSDVRNVLTGLIAPTPYGSQSIARQHADNILQQADRVLAAKGYAPASNDKLAAEIAGALIAKAPEALARWEKEEAEYQADLAEQAKAWSGRSW